MCALPRFGDTVNHKSDGCLGVFWGGRQVVAVFALIDDEAEYP